jgi:hypothetical protein
MYIRYGERGCGDLESGEAQALFRVTRVLMCLGSPSLAFIMTHRCGSETILVCSKKL